MEFTDIEWTDHTFNGWIGCSKTSAGCQHCYAETLMDTRYGRVEWGPKGTRVRTGDDNWRQPHRWNCEAEEQGIRYRVFCSSLADVFEDRPEIVPWRQDLFKMIRETPSLDWLLLTKRPQNIKGMMPKDGLTENVWIGTSVEDADTARDRIPILRSIPASVRFLSVEPLLGPIPRISLRGMDWVIVGGESGHGARPMEADWVRSIRDRCQEQSVAFFFKQWGGIRPKKAGRMLDGRTWDEFPEPNPARLLKSNAA